MSTELLAFQQLCAARGWETRLGDSKGYLLFNGIVTGEVARKFTELLSKTDLPKVWSSRLSPLCDDLDVMLPVYTVFITHLDWPQSFPEWLRARVLEGTTFPNVTHLGCPNLCVLLNLKCLGHLRTIFPNLKKIMVDVHSNLPQKSTVEELAGVFPRVKIMA